MNSRTLQRIIFGQAILATLWSLYFSNFGDPLTGLFSGNGFEPCHFCRWGRILMYHLVIISWIGLFTNDKNSRKYSIIQAVLGLCLAIYHVAIQQRNATNVFSCAPGNPCATIDRHFGFVTIPVLEAIAFAVILCCSIALRRKSRFNK